MSREKIEEEDTIIKDSLDASIRELGEHIEKSKERQFRVTRNSRENININRIIIIRKQKHERKKKTLDISSNKILQKTSEHC